MFFKVQNIRRRPWELYLITPIYLRIKSKPILKQEDETLKIHNANEYGLFPFKYHIKEYFLDAESKGPDYEVHGNLANSETRR